MASETRRKFIGLGTERTRLSPAGRARLWRAARVQLPPACCALTAPRPRAFTCWARDTEVKQGGSSRGKYPRSIRSKPMVMKQALGNWVLRELGELYSSESFEQPDRGIRT